MSEKTTIDTVTEEEFIEKVMFKPKKAAAGKGMGA